jgi:hypothetical protein
MMERRPDSNAPAILWDNVLNKGVTDRISVSDTEDVVERGAQIEPAESPRREE